MADGDIVPCACGGGCGLTFIRTQSQRKRRFAPNCPIREQQLEEAKRESARKSNKKQKVGRRTHCICGCGLKFPEGTKYYRFHPDCETRAAAIRARSSTPTERSKRGCYRCEGLAHRRDQPKCRGCGKYYEPLPELHAVDFLSNKYAQGWSL